jgi:hypothetical protein
MQYWQSKLGEESYKKIELKYPTHPFDTAYQRFLKVTRSSPEKDNKFIINKLIRLQLAPNDENNEIPQEVILYDLCEIRLDGLGNVKKFARTNLGKYPVPSRTVIKTYDEDNQPVIKTGSVSEINTGYEFPFTKEKADELHKWCIDKRTIKQPNLTQYIVERSGERKISVRSFSDWRDGDFETLYAFGNAEGLEEESPAAKPNKTQRNKTKLQQQKEEQLELQLAQYKKPYTTNVKPKEEENKETASAAVSSSSSII